MSFDQIVNVSWFINGATISGAGGNSTTSSYYLNNTPSLGTWNITVNGTNDNGTALYSWNWTVRPKTYLTGNRVWDATKGMSTTYTWNPYSFSGFYYNLDNDLGTENLTIKNIDRNLDKGDVIYTTTPYEVNFTYSRFGKYQVIGFMAEKYFAGYTSNTNPPGQTSTINAVSTLSSGQLHKVLLDDKDKRTISEGGTFTLKEGYVLRIKAVDIGAGPGQIWYVLLKDGSEVDQGTLAGDQTYVYEASRVGGVTDLPIIIVHFTNVFRGREINAAFIEGVFQISDNPTNVKSGDMKGNMKVTSVDASQIKMINENTIDLSAGVTRDLMGNLKIMVADNSSVLRFGLTTDISGSYEVRGTIYDATDEWTPMNFGMNVGGTNIGFYYDIDGDVGSEKFKLATNISGQRQIAENGLVYTTSPQNVNFKYSRFGSYQVIGFMAKKYFAAYTSDTHPPGQTSNIVPVSALSASQLHEVLLDDKDKRTVSEGGTLTLKEGYVLQIKAVDIGAGPGQIWYVLLKDGSEVDQGTLAGDQTYVYEPDKVGSVSDLPIIIVHFTNVFRGREINAAFVEGVFQISATPTYVKSGDRKGNMEVTSVDSTQITMKNKGTISLSSSSTSDVMGDIKFKVADSSTLRFYPFVTVTENMIANQLVIDAPSKATAGDVINIKVTAGGNTVGNASLSIDSTDAGQTDNNGILNYTLPKTLKGNYNITATKLGYQKAIRGIEILQYIEYRLSMEAPSKANQFETMRIRITYNGSAISGATVTYDNATIGTTNSNGTLDYKLETSGTHTVSASKTGYITVSREVEVRAPFTEYKALDINVTPEVIFSGQKYLVRSNITNVGTKADTQPVVLLVNGSVAGSTNVTIDPGKTQEINFTQEMTLPKGNYTVEIMSQKKTVEVKEEPLSYLLIGGLVTGLGAVIIYVLTAKNKISLDAIKSSLNIETMRSKLNMEAIKKMLEKSGKKGI
ncbi:MAG: S-layer protein domain-containing protein [Candidatus Methanoperedens sp.]|nr:S-layer protein domain-containing protein [Candidatus Methanoperedens sp.]